MSIEENVETVLAEIAAAARAAGRDPGEVTLCAATKMNDSQAVRRAIAAGVRVLWGKPRAGAYGQAGRQRL